MDSFFGYFFNFFQKKVLNLFSQGKKQVVFYVKNYKRQSEKPRKCNFTNFSENEKLDKRWKRCQLECGSTTSVKCQHERKR